LAIVGTKTGMREHAPWDDLDYDIWIFNEAPMQDWVKRWTAVFQMHKPEVYQSANNFVRKDHWDWLQQDHPGKTIWMQDYDNLVPNGKRYPLDEVIASVPGANMKWLQPPVNHYPHRKTWIDLSAVYALALGIYLGYEDIEVYGMDLNSNTEYTYQLGCWRFWVGIALGMGIHLTVKCSADDFGTNFLYGYDGEIQIEREYFQGRTAEFDGLWKTAENNLHKLKDKIGALLLDHKYDKIHHLYDVFIDAAMNAGELAGAMAEAEHYAARLDIIPRQEFERRAAEAQIEGEAKRKETWHYGGIVEYVWNVLTKTGSYDALAQMRDFFEKERQSAYAAGANFGKMKENQHYMVEYDLRLTAAGGERTRAALTEA